MRLVKGAEAARLVLARHVDTQEPEASEGLRKGIAAAFGEELSVKQVVQRIIRDVRRQGDVAVVEYTQRLDGVKLEALEVTVEERDSAKSQVPEGLVSALQFAADRIAEFHSRTTPATGMRLQPDGTGVMTRPLDRVGIYVPGGRACYPSTVLMTVVPAKVAGVREIVLCTPPAKDGCIPAPTLAAAGVAGVSRIYKAGGAQAIAAMAFGTESVPRVDKICGPGNIFVMMAKKEVFGAVDIDGLQGPSELVVVADDCADPAFCASDLLAQGEHDPLARVVLITLSEERARRVEREISRQMQAVSRGNIATESVLANGIMAVVGDIREAIELVNVYAPEHVSLMVQDADNWVPLIHNAGCIFVGSYTAPAFGDYVAGPSHVLPTGGTARFSSPLGVMDFYKTTSVVKVSQKAACDLADAACTISTVEGLDAHCKSIELRNRRV